MPPLSGAVDGHHDATTEPDAVAAACDGPPVQPRRAALQLLAARDGRSGVAGTGRRGVVARLTRWCGRAPAEPLAEAGGPSKDAPAAEALKREVLLNAPPAASTPPHAGYAGNKVTTAKYNLLTFLPRFTLEMFSRVAYMCACCAF